VKPASACPTISANVVAGSARADADGGSTGTGTRVTFSREQAYALEHGFGDRCHIVGCAHSHPEGTSLDASPADLYGARTMAKEFQPWVELICGFEDGEQFAANSFVVDRAGRTARANLIVERSTC
jgi:hypothetical protein